MNKNIRHPEKRNLKDQFSPKKPDWIKVRFTNNQTFLETKKIVRNNNLITVCEEANCPNISECWSKKHATLMIMGDICTRACSFCNISTGKPLDLDYFEPYNIATAVKKLGLKHVVITSVDRDDLEDGGVKHFIKTIKSIRQTSPKTTIEVLTPDFIKNKHASIQLSEAEPDVFNHNLETVPRLYNEVRPGARYFNSLKLLNDVKSFNKKIFTKSGIMVGLGEKKEEVIQVMDDLRSADVDFLTIGQYLQPSIKHHKVDRYVDPNEFKLLKNIAISKGFLLVSSSPLTRSSYHADEDFLKLKEKRLKII
tara:strand:+ start:1061 stop:1987 length:927 start_codon:yes stop_codon:yes gene_type:complete